MRSRLGLAIVLVAQILVVEAMGGEYESALEHKTETGVEADGVNTHKTADQPVSGVTESSERESEAADAPESRRLGKHHSSDKSVAGGGVIIGGLVTAVFATVFCYIRVTRKRDTTH